MKFTILNSNKFKTNLCSVFLAVPLSKDTVTATALIPSVLRRGTKNLKSQLEINKKLEEMYGASISIGVEKEADFEVLKFYLEVINDDLLPEKRELTKEGLELLIDIIFNPYIEQNANGESTFCKQYVEQEKDNLIKVIESRKDNKANYAANRMIEEMYEGEPYGIYKFGNVEDLKEIDEKNLYDFYKALIKKAKISVYVAGNIQDNTLENDFKQSLEKLGISKENDFELINKKHEPRQTPKIVNEKMDVSQGNLIIGLDVTSDKTSEEIMIYNAVLGTGANSKLFQNVREKASLAYSAGSKYYRRKDMIMIRTGIEIANYEKALEIIEKQIKDMKDGIISNQEIESAKQFIISTLKLIPESSESLISYYYDKEIRGEEADLDAYINAIQNVQIKDIVEVAQDVLVDTIYFLRN